MLSRGWLVGLFSHIGSSSRPLRTLRMPHFLKGCSAIVFNIFLQVEEIHSTDFEKFVQETTIRSLLLPGQPEL